MPQWTITNMLDTHFKKPREKTKTKTQNTENQMEQKNIPEIKPSDGLNIRLQGAEKESVKLKRENTQPEEQRENYYGLNYMSTTPKPPIHVEALTAPHPWVTRERAFRRLRLNEVVSMGS